MLSHLYFSFLSSKLSPLSSLGLSSVHRSSMLLLCTSIPPSVIFFFTRNSQLTRATNPHQQLQPQCFLSFPRLFFVAPEMQSNSLQLLSPTEQQEASCSNPFFFLPTRPIR
jgi:hypothetical protein